MRVTRDEVMEGCFDLSGLTGTQIGTIRRALERYGTPMATELYLSIRKDLRELGEIEEEDKSNGKQAETSSPKFSVPLIICQS